MFEERYPKKCPLLWPSARYGSSLAELVLHSREPGAELTTLVDALHGNNENIFEKEIDFHDMKQVSL